MLKRIHITVSLYHQQQSKQRTELLIVCRFVKILCSVLTLKTKMILPSFQRKKSPILAESSRRKLLINLNLQNIQHCMFRDGCLPSTKKQGCHGPASMFWFLTSESLLLPQASLLLNVVNSALVLYHLARLSSPHWILEVSASIIVVFQPNSLSLTNLSMTKQFQSANHWVLRPK